MRRISRTVARRQGSSGVPFFPVRTTSVRGAMCLLRSSRVGLCLTLFDNPRRRGMSPKTSRAASRDRRTGKASLRSNASADATVLLTRGIAPINWRGPDGPNIGVAFDQTVARDSLRDPFPASMTGRLYGSLHEMSSARPRRQPVVGSRSAGACSDRRASHYLEHSDKPSPRRHVAEDISRCAP